MLSTLWMEIRKLVGANMRRHRLAAQLSQEAVAERMGVDRAHVSSMERGQQNVTLETLASAAGALGVRPGAFFDEGAAPAPAGVKAPRTRRLISPRD